MQQSYWGYWLILLGIFVVVVMMLIQSATTGNTQDYLMMKEVTQASMVDSVDFAYFRVYGEVKMNKEKFVENFIRRFAEDVKLSTNYNIKFYDLYEVPPKATVRVTSKTNSMNVANANTSFDIVNDISTILEFGYSESGGNEVNKRMCPLMITPNFAAELRNYLSETGKATQDEINKIQDSDYDSVKKAFADAFPGYAAMSTEELQNDPDYKIILEWIDRGILQIHD